MTSVTIGRDGAPGRQRFAVSVRNMFEEERAGSPGPIEISAVPAGLADSAGGAADAEEGGTLFRLMIGAFRRLFGTGG